MTLGQVWVPSVLHLILQAPTAFPRDPFGQSSRPDIKWGGWCWRNSHSLLAFAFWESVAPDRSQSWAQLIRKIGTVGGRSSSQEHDRTLGLALRWVKPHMFSVRRYVTSTETLLVLALQLLAGISGDWSFGLTGNMLILETSALVSAQSCCSGHPGSGCQTPVAAIYGGCGGHACAPGLESQSWALLPGLLKQPRASRSFSVFKTSWKY